MKNFFLFWILVLSVCSLGMRGVGNPQPNTVIVPNVEGITVEVAVKILQTVGLQPQFQSSSLSAIVVRQDPRPGFSLPIGGEVILSTGAAVGITQQPTGTRRVQYLPSVAPQPGTPAEGVFRANISGTPVITTRTNVSVTPYQAPQQGSQVLAYSVSLPGGQSQILYQPPQPPVSQYFVADTTPRFYPAWYPRQFLTLVNPPISISKSLSESMRITVQPQVTYQTPVSPYVVPGTEPRVYPVWYPRVFSSQESSQFRVSESQPDRQQWVGVFAISTTPVVPVPKVLRLYQEDAIAAIAKTGLSIGNITRVQSSQVGTGIVVKQSPQHRAIVPAGTPVDLWVAN